MERDLQKKCITHAERYKFVARKVHAEGRKGWPDLLLIAPTGRVVFVELKHPDKTGRLSILQARERDAIQANGGLVYTVDSFADFESIIKGILCAGKS